MARSTRLSRSIWIAVVAAAALAVALFAASAGQAQSTSGAAAGTSHVELRLGGDEVGGRFLNVAIGGNSNDVVEHVTADQQGKQRVEKAPGQVHYGNIVLRRAIEPSGSDESLRFSTWRQQVIEGKFNDVRVDGTISIIDWQGKPVATWSFKRGWPSAYSVSPVTVGSKAKPYERITISHEGMERRSSP